MSFTEFLKAKKAFFIPVLIFILTGIVFLSLYSKSTIHLAQNAWHGPHIDVFFKYMTYGGDGLAFAAAVPILIFYKRRHFIGFLVSAVLTLFLTAGLKTYFKEVPRPVKYFEGKHEIHLVEGVHNHSFQSFPSGHTTTAFACWGFLAFVLRSAGLQFGLALIALLVGYSRIAISQHFLIDVVGGTILGTFIATVAYLFCLQIKKPWADRRLLKFNGKD